MAFESISPRQVDIPSILNFVELQLVVGLAVCRSRNEILLNR